MPRKKPSKAKAADSARTTTVDPTFPSTAQCVQVLLELHRQVIAYGPRAIANVDGMKEVQTILSMLFETYPSDVKLQPVRPADAEEPDASDWDIIRSEPLVVVRFLNIKLGNALGRVATSHDSAALISAVHDHQMLAIAIDCHNGLQEMEDKATREGGQELLNKTIEAIRELDAGMYMSKTMLKAKFDYGPVGAQCLRYVIDALPAGKAKKAAQSLLSEKDEMQDLFADKLAEAMKGLKGVSVADLP